MNGCLIGRFYPHCCWWESLQGFADCSEYLRVVCNLSLLENTLQLGTEWSLIIIWWASLWVPGFCYLPNSWTTNPGKYMRSSQRPKSFSWQKMNVTLLMDFLSPWFSQNYICYKYWNLVLEARDPRTSELEIKRGFLKGQEKFIFIFQHKWGQWTFLQVRK